MTTLEEIQTASRLLADQKIQREHFKNMLWQEGLAGTVSLSNETFSSMVDGGVTWVPASKGKDAMTPERWQRIKALKPRDKQMFVSCAPDKDKHSRATYRKAEHAK